MQVSKSLVIVESPTKAKTISKILGAGYIVKASVGHIFDLPKDRLGVDIYSGFKPQYQCIKGKGKIIQELKEAAAKSSHILIATDPDREGEAIAHHIYTVVAEAGKPIDRVLFHEITPNAVSHAVENPHQIDSKKVDAQQARRVLDRLVGYLVSPILWKTIAKGLSAGRVQSVALRMICERQAEIRLFKTQEYWTIDASLAAESVNPFRARAVSFKSKKLTIPHKSAADTHLKYLQQAEYTLKDRKVKNTKRLPKPPFTTSTLQQEAGNRLRFPNTKTMRIAQSLYEGVELGVKGSTGLITYMRTDSVRVAPEAVSRVREYIADTYGVEYIPMKPRIYSSKGRTQEAHEAIRPTDIRLEPQKVKKFLTKEQFVLYQLIYNRFVASQMADAVFKQTTLIIYAGEYEFRAVGSEPIFRGFLQVWSENGGDDPKDEKKTEKPAKIPANISVGQTLDLKELIPEQHFTEPPPRFTESSLVKALEENGVGRPSTYAAIISVLYERKYVQQNERALDPTELGETVNNILISNFPDIFSVDFTANMENRLDKVEAGDLFWDKVVDDFYQPFNHTLEAIKSRKDEIRRSLQEPTGEKCEKCGGELVIRWGKNGKFIACSNFPKCRNTKPLNNEVPEKSDKKCPDCGGVLLVKNGRFGRFLGCSDYPKCKHVEPIDLGITCPQTDCDGRIVERRTKKGKTFFGCNKYPDCKFISWEKPVNQHCPECGSPYMVIRRQKESEFWFCPKCKHKVKPE